MFSGKLKAQHLDVELAYGAYIGLLFQGHSLTKAASHKDLGDINVISTMFLGRIIYLTPIYGLPRKLSSPLGG
jgi:hypothetical protein